MIYLILSIFFMAALAVSFGEGARRGVSALGLNLVFRMTGGVLSILVMLSWQKPGSVSALWPQVGGLGLLAGFFYWASGITAIQAVRQGHLGVTWTVLRCAMVLPTMASILFWHELPLRPISLLLVLRLSGVLLTVIVAILIGLDRWRPHPADRSRPVNRTWILWLLAAFCGQGAWETSLRASGAFTDEAARAVFISTVFITASILALAVWAVHRPRLGRNELTYGCLAGICGFLGSGLRPWALRDLPGVIVFPVTAISVMLLVQVAAKVFFGHRLSAWGGSAVALAVIAVILLVIPI